MQKLGSDLLTGGRDEGACAKTCCTEAFLYTHAHSYSTRLVRLCVSVCTKDFRCKFIFIFMALFGFSYILLITNLLTLNNHWKQAE